MSQEILRSARLWLVLFGLTAAAGPLSALSVEEVAGSIKADFGVNHNGDATYSVPIDVPPGTGGMQPHLTLLYESGVADGPMGVGWRLEGLEQITRCRPTLAQDGFSAPIRYDEYVRSYRFCIDGERLVAISGEYGADGTIY
ncbi:MAG: SpvB/TcaC N-terminal domain-containing protein, partial [Acidobacteriota bacterium]